jgi:hypothetical protein
MNYCHVSRQIDEYAHQLGLEAAMDMWLEKTQLEQGRLILKMTNRRLASLGRFHCKHGIKPMSQSQAYLDAYSTEYARENINF